MKPSSMGKDNSVSHGIYIYRAIATNMESKSDSDIVQWYNLRGETSENRIKELRSDFSGANLPCGDFHANAAWFKLSSLGIQSVCLDAYGVADEVGRRPERLPYG